MTEKWVFGLFVACMTVALCGLVNACVRVKTSINASITADCELWAHDSTGAPLICAKYLDKAKFRVVAK